MIVFFFIHFSFLSFVFISFTLCEHVFVLNIQCAYELFMNFIIIYGRFTIVFFLYCWSLLFSILFACWSSHFLCVKTQVFDTYFRLHTIIFHLLKEVHLEMFLLAAAFSLGLNKLKQEWRLNIYSNTKACNQTRIKRDFYSRFFFFKNIPHFRIIVFSNNWYDISHCSMNYLRIVILLLFYVSYFLAWPKEFV